MLSLCLGAFSQEITVRFTGQLNGTSYCRLDSVKITNLTRDWTETVVYPDTIIVQSATVGTDLNIAATQGLGQNIPNPFDCETRVELSVSQRENVRMKLLDASGKQYAEYSGSLDAGVHTFDISAAAPQTYVLNATVGNRSYSIRMVNTGSGCGCSIKYAGVSGGVEAKLTTINEFQIGDNMRYVGYATIGGDNIESTAIEQMLVTSQYITLNFTHFSSPNVETLSATNITISGATLNGNVISDGNATVTARGFVYGTSSSNLSQTVQSGSGIGSFTANITGLTSGTTYYYKAFAINSAGTAYGNVMSFTSVDLEATTGTYNGHEWVDLGLPSGLLWATTNIGANASEFSGNYYAWGETTIKYDFSWSTYKYCNGSSSTITKYCDTDNLTILEEHDDAATVNWGYGWRMPTSTEIQELIDNCTETWTIQNSVRGYKFTGPNGNSIFLPAAGYRFGNENFYNGNDVNSRCYYWSSSLSMEVSQAEKLAMSSSSFGVVRSFRNWGIPVRAVCPSGSVGVSAPFVITDTVLADVTTTSAIISGNVTSDGGATVTDKGFLYGTSSSNLSEIIHSGSGCGSFTANLTGLTPATTYYYKTYATNSAGTTYGEVRQLFTHGTYNGHEWVDLGLPSGLYWATCNVGATNPEDYGDYYAWGETSTKETFTEDTYTYHSNPTTLPSNADAATANWGAQWRMPTYDELNEFETYCTSTWITQNGVYGRIYVGPNGNSIFLPAGYLLGDDYYAGGGDYWSSSLGTYNTCAWCFQFNNVTVGQIVSEGSERYLGLSVRPVCPNGSTGVSLSIVTTGVASDITGSCATLSGNIVSDCGATVTDRGFIYGTSSSNLSETIQSGSGVGDFTANISGLAPSTTYYYKAYATNSAGTAYGALKSFSTPSLPTVTTVRVRNITQSGATLYGSVSNDGGTTVTSRGFLYGTSANNLTQIVQSDNGTGNYNKALTGLSSNTTYYYKAYAANSVDTAFGGIKMFTTLAEAGTINGHDWVDLGLPSGIRWAACNIGFTAPEGAGKYYAWGETTPKGNYTAYSWNNYSFCNGSSTKLTKYCNNSSYGNNSYTDNLTVLEASDDAATANWGSEWRMPTYDEMTELNTRCTKTWTTQNGVNGYIFTGPNGNSIFLPAAGYRQSSSASEVGNYGYYWSSSLYTDVPYNARTLYFSASTCTVNNRERRYGQSVRPVCQVSETNVSLPTVITGAPCNITTTGATITGFVTYDGGAIFCDHGFIYGTNADNLTHTVWCGGGTGSFTINLTNLSPDSTYCYKAYVTNNEGTVYGEVMSFTTANNLIVYSPTVITVSASETDNGATFSGNLISDGNTTETIRGFIYGTSESTLTQSVDCGSGAGSYTASITGLNSGSTYYYKAYATNSVGTSYGEVKTFNTSINGHVWVDLGLPSGLRWATCNVDAATAEAYGNYYAWGETATKDVYYDNNYTYSDSPTTLPADADAATVQWGAGWRMPTSEEFNELKNRCSTTWTTQNGVSGRLFTSRTNGNSIFLPAAGRMYGNSIYDATNYGEYLSSSIAANNTSYAKIFRIYSSGSDISGYYRYMGYSVRPVCTGITTPSVTTGMASNITITSATISGNAISDGDTDITARGFMYGTSEDSLTLTVQSGSGSGNFTADLTDLNSGIVYYYMAYATNSAGTTYGGIMSFSTGPVVTTGQVSNITSSDATISGEVVSYGEVNITLRGFIYGTSEDNLTQNIQCGSGTGSFTANLTDLTSNTTYYYKAFATNSVSTSYGEVRSFTTPEIGREWVDLGLPSGTLWATCNVGANSPEEYGDYFAWGETSTKETYNSSTYKYGYLNSTSSTLTKYCNNADYGNNGFTDTLTTLEACDDAATANWGPGWRMPTYDEMNELNNNCTVTWTTQNGVNGRLFTGPNGNSIFLPAAGYRYGSELSAGSFSRYWSSSLYTDYPYYARYLYFHSGNCYIDYYYRCYGYSVRPVCVSQN